MTISQSLEHSWIKVRSGLLPLRDGGRDKLQGGSPEWSSGQWEMRCPLKWWQSHLTEASAGILGPSVHTAGLPPTETFRKSHL